jgi:thiosulfate/3-mercaptopyruvate sulfurtransferase
MKRKMILIALALLLSFLPLTAMAKSHMAAAKPLPPLVTTEELAVALTTPGVVVVDIRKVEDYKAGHIPGAINVFYGSWAIKKGETDNEMPEDDDLTDIIGGAGIKADATVVVYGRTDTPPERVNVTRVAWVLKYAGVEKVSVLSGGFDKWTCEKRAISTDTAVPKSVNFKAKFSKNILVDKTYVLANVNKALIVDVREPDFYNGKQKLPFIAKTGRIAGAVNLPTAQVFAKYPPEADAPGCGMVYKGADALKSMAVAVIGDDLNREIIVYCDTGRFASAWWFVLTEVLGYKNVKLYDGSTQEWMRDDTAPIE